jgi:hypothetical protein
VVKSSFALGSQGHRFRKRPVSASFYSSAFSTPGAFMCYRNERTEEARLHLVLSPRSEHYQWTSNPSSLPYTLW